MLKNSILLVVTAFLLHLCYACKQIPEEKQVTEGKEAVITDDTPVNITVPDTIDSDSIRMYADLLYDSLSYIVLENRSPLPIAYNALYRFDQKVHGKWTTVKTRSQDTTIHILPPAEKDTLVMDLAKDIGYQPLGPCRIYKTIRTVNNDRQYELVYETEVRTRIIDWDWVDLVPADTEFNTQFVSMTATAKDKKIIVTIRNKTDKEIIFGDETDFTISVFKNNTWYDIVYSKLINSVAMILQPDGTIKDMEHNLSGINYSFDPGQYRISKEFFFGKDYKNKYVAGAGFNISEEEQ